MKWYAILLLTLMQLIAWQIHGQIEPCDRSANCCALRFPEPQQLDSLCLCFLATGQALRRAEDYADAIKYLKVVNLMCPDKKAQGIIDSIYNEHRIWIKEDGPGKRYAIANPLGQLVEQGQSYDPYRFSNPQNFKKGVAVCENGNGRYLLVDKNGKILNNPSGSSYVISAKDNMWVTVDENGELGPYRTYSQDRLRFNLIKNKELIYENLSLDLLPAKLQNQGIFLLQDWLQTIPLVNAYEDIHPLKKGVFRGRKKYGPGYSNSKQHLMLTNGQQIDTLVFTYLGELDEGMIPFDTENSTGLLNTKGEKIFEIPAESGEYYRQGLFVIETDEGELLIDTSGQVCIKLDSFADLGDFYHGVTYFSWKENDEKYGIINTKGEIISEPKYSYLGEFYEGIASAQRRTKWYVGAINTQDSVIVPIKYWDVGDFYHGVTYVRKRKKYGVIDQHNNLIAPIEYDSISEFTPGFALVKKDSRYGLMNPSGDFILPVQYRAIRTVAEDHFKAQMENKRWVLLDQKGKAVLPGSFESVNTLSKRLIAVKRDSLAVMIDTWNYDIAPIDSFDFSFPYADGISLLFRQNDSRLRNNVQHKSLPIDNGVIFPFQNGWARVFVDGKYRFVHQGLRRFSPESYDGASDFEKGRAMVWRDRQVGLVDSNFQFLIPIEYSSIDTFHSLFYKAVKGSQSLFYLDQGVSLLLLDYRVIKQLSGSRYLVHNDQGFGVLDTVGFQMIIPMSFDKISQLANNYYVVKEGDYVGLRDSMGNPFLASDYHQIELLEDNTYKVRKGKLVGLLDSIGNPIIPVEYTQIRLRRDQVYEVQKDEQYGTFDKNGRPIIPVAYDQIHEIYSNRYHHSKVKKGNLFGVYDSIGHQLIPVDYDQIYSRHKNTYVVKKGKYTGVYDALGNLLVPVDYDRIYAVGEESYEVKKGEQFNLIFVKGKPLVPDQYDQIRKATYWPSTYIVQKGKQYGVVGPDGQVLIPVEYDQISALGNNTFQVKKGEQYGIFEADGQRLLIPVRYQQITMMRGYRNSVFTVKEEGKYGIFDRKGRELAPPIYENLYHDWRHNSIIELYLNGRYNVLDIDNARVIPDWYDRIEVWPNKYFKVARNNSYGIMDSTGVITLPLVYEEIDVFEDGSITIRKGEKVGLIDSTGVVLAEPKYDYISHLHAGVAIYRLGNKYGIMTTGGDRVVSPIYDEMKDFVNGLARVKSNGHFGFVNVKGDTIIPIIYDEAEDFYDGMAIVGRDGKYGCIDTLNQVQVPIQFDDVYNFVGDRARVQISFQYGFINRTGKPIIPLEYDNAHDFTGEIALVRKDGENYFIDRSGTRLVPDSITDISYLSIGLWNIAKNDSLALLNDAGELLVPFDRQAIEVYSRYNANKKIITLTKGSSINYGLLSKDNRLILPASYDTIQFKSGTIIQAKRGSIEKYGLLDWEGKLVLPFQYDSIGCDRNKVVVKTDGELAYGLLADNGQVLIPPIYDAVSVDHFLGYTERIALTKDAKTTYGLVNAAGELIISPTQDTIFKNGRIVAARQNDQVKYGLLNDSRDGNLALSISNESIQDRISNGRYFYQVCQAGSCGLLDDSFAWVVPRQYEQVKLHYDGKIEAIRGDSSVYGLMDSVGRLVLEVKYEFYRQHFADVRDIIEVRHQKKVGLFHNKENRFILPLEYEAIEYYYDGQRRNNRLFKIKKEGKEGLINHLGEIIIPPVYQSINRFSDGLYEVGKEDKFGIVDSLDHIILPLEYKYIGSLDQDLHTIEADSKYGLINEKAEIVIPCYLDRRPDYHESYLLLYANGKKGVYYREQSSFIPPIYDKIIDRPGELVMVLKDGKWGWIRRNGQVQIPLQYDMAIPFDAKGKAWVYQYDLYFQINQNGEMTW